MTVRYLYYRYLYRLFPSWLLRFQLQLFRFWKQLVVLLFLVLLGFFVNWGYRQDWTGFNVTPDYSATDQRPGKYLWDWMELVLVPLVLALVGFWYSYSQRRSELEIAEQERQKDRDIAAEEQQKDREIAEQTRAKDREIAANARQQELQLAKDRAEEAILQAFIDRMEYLLLKEGLRTGESDSEVVNIARVRTLTVLRSLNSERKGILVKFLYDTGLIQQYTGTGLLLRGADLSNISLPPCFLRSICFPNVNLVGAFVKGVHLEKAMCSFSDFTGANFSHSHLTEADMRCTQLVNANFSHIKLDRANLSEAMIVSTNLADANLEGACLQKAVLHKVNLRGANLANADFTGATLVDTNLSEAHNLDSAVLEDITQIWEEMDEPSVNGGAELGIER